MYQKVTWWISKFGVHDMDWGEVYFFNSGRSFSEVSSCAWQQQQQQQQQQQPQPQPQPRQPAEYTKEINFRMCRIREIPDFCSPSPFRHPWKQDTVIRQGSLSYHKGGIQTWWVQMLLIIFEGWNAKNDAWSLGWEWPLMSQGLVCYLLTEIASCVVGLTFARTTMLVLWQNARFRQFVWAATGPKVSLGMASACKVIEF